MDIDADHLLPPGSDEFLKSLSLSQTRMLDVDMDVIRRAVLASVSPAELLPYLAWDRSIDEFADSWPDEVKRQVIEGSYDYHSVKGTPGALKRALAQLNYDVAVAEWFEYDGDPFLFRIAYTIAENATMTEAEFRALLRLIFQAKNARSFLDGIFATAQVRAPAPYIAAWGARRTRTITIYPEES